MVCDVSSVVEYIDTTIASQKLNYGYNSDVDYI